MTLKQIWDVIYDNPGFYPVVIILVLSLVEVSKIKLNPWSALGRIVGKLLGIEGVSNKVDKLEKKMDDKVDKLEKKVDDLDHKVEENDIIGARVRILRFASEIEDRKYHSKDSWNQVMTDILKYEKYTNEHPNFKNGITEPTTEYLKEQYKERLDKKDWNRKND